MGKVIQYTLGMANGFFVVDDGIIAVDSGSLLGADLFKEVCDTNGIDPRDIKLIAVTHGHVDHFFNAGEMRALTGAPIMCHVNAAESLREGLRPQTAPRTEVGRMILSGPPPEGAPVSGIPKVAPDIEVSGTVDLGEWGIAGKLVETPGHSQGCMSFVGDWGDAIVGDLIVEEPGTGAATLAYFAYAEDVHEASVEIVDSVKKLLSFEYLNTFYSGHGGPFSRDDVAVACQKEEAAL